LEFGHEVTHPISRTYNVRVEGITSITKYSAGTTVIVKIEVQDNKQVHRYILVLIVRPMHLLPKH